MMDLGFLKDIFIAWMTVFSVTLFIISLISYVRTRSGRIVLVSLAFLMFSVKGAVLSIGLYRPDLLRVSSDLPSLLFDVLILLILYFATVRE
jgi:hypothetical protein